jgi:hypothetical protein
LKKSSKKLFERWALGSGADTARAPASKVFLLLFLQKKKSLLRLPRLR